MWDEDATHPLTFEHEHDEPVSVVQVVDGPDRGHEIVFGEGVITVGKSEGAVLRLTDPTVSRLHLTLEHQGDAVRVRDLGSKNGTWIGPAQILEARVPPGTRLRVGTTEIALAVRHAIVRRLEWKGEDRLGALVGTTPAMHQLFARLVRVAGGDSRILLRGESGTGKELAARTIHELSRRAAGPFVVLDGAALSDTLAEDELFGHVPGAFTGASTERAGAFERAHSGTLFLDEIGDVPLALQTKLLRALEDGSVQRLGASERRTVDVRVIAATHKPLEQMVNERTFREDLYYRLAVIELRMPSLRDRLADVPMIALEILRHDERDDPQAFTQVQAALAEHLDYPWPGNVRELRNFVRRVSVLGPAHAQLGPLVDDRPQVHADLPFHEAKERWIEHFERRYVERILEESSGNIAEAARRSGVSRVHLSNLAGRYGLRRAR